MGSVVNNKDKGWPNNFLMVLRGASVLLLAHKECWKRYLVVELPVPTSILLLCFPILGNLCSNGEL